MRNSDLTCICKGCIPAYCPALFEKLNFNRPVLTQRMVNLTGSPPVESHLTCIAQTNSPCLYSHEDVMHISISAGNYFYSYIIIPATITHNNVLYIHMIKHINHQFVFTHMHTDIISYARSIRNAPITTKDNTLLNLF